MITPRLHRKLTHYIQLLLSSKQHSLCRWSLRFALVRAVRTGSSEAVAAILAVSCNCSWSIYSLVAAGIVATEENNIAIYKQLSATAAGTPHFLAFISCVLRSAAKRQRFAMAVAVLKTNKPWWTQIVMHLPVLEAVQHARSNMVAALLSHSYTGVVWTADQLQPYIETAIREKRGKEVLQELLAAANNGFTSADLAAARSLALRLCHLEALEVLLAVDTGDTTEVVAAAVKPLMLEALVSEYSKLLIPKLLALVPGAWARGEVMVMEAVVSSWEGLEQQVRSEAGKAVDLEAGEITGILHLMVAFGDLAAKRKRQQLHKLASSTVARGPELPFAQVPELVLDPFPAAYWPALQCVLSMPQCPREPAQLLGVLKVAAGLGGKDVLSQLLLEPVQQVGGSGLGLRVGINGGVGSWIGAVGGWMSRWIGGMPNYPALSTNPKPTYMQQEGMAPSAVDWKVQQLQEATDAAAGGEEWEAMAQLLLARRVGWQVGELRDATELLGEQAGVAHVVSLLLQLPGKSDEGKVMQIAAALKAIHASVPPGASQCATVGYGIHKPLDEKQLLWQCLSELLHAGMGHWGPKQLQGLLYDAAAAGMFSVAKQLLSGWEGWEGELMQEALTAAAHRRDAKMMQLLLEGAGPAGWRTQQLQKVLVAAVTGGPALVQQLLGAPGLRGWDSGSLVQAVSAAAKHGCWGLLRCLVEMQGLVWEEEQLREAVGWADEYGHAGMVQTLQGLYISFLDDLWQF